MNFQMFKLALEKAEEPEIKLPTSIGSSKKPEFQKNIYFCIIDYAKAFDCVDHNKLWKIVQEMEIPDHLTSSWEICMQVRKQQLDMEQQTGPNRRRSMSRLYIVTLLIQLLCRVYHEKCWVEEAQAVIKIAGRNINNLRYADDTTLMAESEEELKSLLMRMKEES